MPMSEKTRSAVERFARVVLSGAAAAAALGLPALFELIPVEYAFVGTPVLAAALAALDKARRYGEDVGEV